MINNAGIPPTAKDTQLLLICSIAISFRGLPSRCGVNPAGIVRDEEGRLLGYGSYCSQCEESLDFGPFSRLVQKVGPEKATKILKELVNKNNPRSF